jgi:Cytokine-induced anti-apoptosis inhibitor 1, Fe-S biogenesis
VGKTRKACKNCTCGRAEAEAEAERKLLKFGLTHDQINNPRSACGSVSDLVRIQFKEMEEVCLLSFWLLVVS